MCKIGILHKRFVNKAMLPLHVFKRKSTSLPGKLAQNINNKKQKFLSRKTVALFPSVMNELRLRAAD